MKRIFPLFFFLLLLFSCTQDDQSVYSGDGISVTFSLSGIGPAGSASVASRATGTPLPDGATVRVLAYHRPGGNTGADLSAANYAGEAIYQVSGGGTALAPCTVDDKGVVTSTSGQPMQLLVGTYDFFTVTPALAADHTGAVPVVTVANGVDYASSVTESRVIEASGETRGQTVTLGKLNRQCCKLSFTLRCDETVNTITGMEVEELALTGLSDTPLKTASTPGQAGMLLPAGNSTLTLRGADLPTDAANARLAQGSLIVLPKADAAFGVSMRLCLNGSIVPTVFDEVEVPAMSFDAGREYPLTITLSHGGAVTLTVGSAELWGDGGDQNLNAGLLPGVTVGMPDWTLDEQSQGLGIVTNLNPDGRTANCYIAYDDNSYYGFDATVMGNGATTLSGGFPNSYDIVPQPLAPQSVKVLWETGMTAGGVVSKVQLSPDKTKVLFKTGTDAGNAVIAVYDNANPDDASAKILWSWHIWKPEMEVTDFQYQKYVDNTGIVKAEDNYRMMDRNLGATVATAGVDGSIGALGLFYQWGRKDPFPGIENTTNRNVYFVCTTPLITTADFSCLKSVEDPSTLSLLDNTACITYTIEHPTTYIKAETVHWRSDWIKDKQDNLWGNPWEGNQMIYTDVSKAKTVNSGYGSKSIYDPCPVGYRVPPQDTWSVLYNSDGSVNNIQNKWDSNNETWSTTLLAPTGSAILFVTAGFIDRRDGSAKGNAGDFGNFWYSSPYNDISDTSSGFYQNCYGDFTPFYGSWNFSRTNGYSVRCVSELVSE